MCKDLDRKADFKHINIKGLADNKHCRSLVSGHMDDKQSALQVVNMWSNRIGWLRVYVDY